MQGEYEAACRLVFKTLSELDSRLAKSRYLVTNHQKGWAAPQPTLADWHLLPVLARFDAVYNPLFKANLHYLAHYPHLQARPASQCFNARILCYAITNCQATNSSALVVIDPVLAKKLHFLKSPGRHKDPQKT